MHQRQFGNHPDLPGWAYGFTQRTENGQRVLDHGGADPTGYGSMTVLLPEEDVGFFAVTNARFEEELLLDFPEAFLDHYYPGETLPPDGWEPLPNAEERAERLVGTYLTNRVARHSVAKLSWLSKRPVRVASVEGEPGLIAVTGLGHGRVDGPSRWVEIEPLVFQREGSEDRIGFGAVESGEVTHLHARDRTPGAFGKVVWYQEPAFHQVLVGVCLLVFATVTLGWPLACLVRRFMGQRLELTRSVREARWLAFGVSSLYLAFVIAGGIAMSVYPLQFGLPTGVKALFVVPLLTTAMTVGLPLLGVRAWSNTWSLVGRLQYVLVMLTATAFIWFLSYWNLLGFRF